MEYYSAVKRDQLLLHELMSNIMAESQNHAEQKKTAIKKHM